MIRLFWANISLRGRYEFGIDEQGYYILDHHANRSRRDLSCLIAIAGPRCFSIALNDRLCGKPPRKFGKCNFFQVLFTDEIRRVKTADLHDGNGGPVSVKYVYVESSFAMFTGTLFGKNPAEGEFFRSDAFLSLKCAMNTRDLRVIDHSKFEEPFDRNSCQSTPSECTKDRVDVDSIVESLDCQEETTSPSSTESLQARKARQEQKARQNVLRQELKARHDFTFPVTLLLPLLMILQNASLNRKYRTKDSR